MTMTTETRTVEAVREERRLLSARRAELLAEVDSIDADVNAKARDLFGEHLRRRLAAEDVAPLVKRAFAAREEAHALRERIGRLDEEEARLREEKARPRVGAAARAAADAATRLEEALAELMEATRGLPPLGSLGSWPEASGLALAARRFRAHVARLGFVEVRP